MIFFQLLIPCMFLYSSTPCLELKQTVTSSTKKIDQINRHCLTLKKDQTAYVRIDQPDETFEVEIYQPDGSLLHRHMTTNFLMGESMMEILAPVDGQYELRIKSIYHPKSGINNYSLTLVKQLNPTEILAEKERVLKSKTFSNLKDHFHKIRSADVKDDDFSDLQCLKKAIGNRRIVFLGEATHRDGTTLKMKARIIKFLNQEMGFNILANELSGLFQAYYHSHEAPQVKALDWKNAVYPITSKSKEFYDTAELLNLS